MWLVGSTLKKRLSHFLAICLVPFAICHAVPESVTVTGVVKFPGETPPRAMWVNPDDHDWPHGIAQNHLLVKQETLGLQNALVILERNDRRVMPTRIQAQLSVQGCTLWPRIQWV